MFAINYLLNQYMILLDGNIAIRNEISYEEGIYVWILKIEK